MWVCILYLAPYAIQMPIWKIKQILIKAATYTKLLIHAPNGETKGIQKQSRKLQMDVKVISSKLWNIHYVFINKYHLRFSYGPSKKHGCSSVKNWTCTNLTEVQKLTQPLKMDGWTTTFLLGRPIFRCYVSFREGTNLLSTKSKDLFWVETCWHLW